jgi:hypothetical protein
VATPDEAPTQNLILLDENESICWGVYTLGALGLASGIYLYMNKKNTMDDDF